MPGPPAPSIWRPGLLRAAATEEASKPWEPWPGRREGEAPRGAGARVPCRPPGALSDSGKGPGGGAVGAEDAGSGAHRGLWFSRGSSWLPGVGWWGGPGPQSRCTNRRRTRSRQEAREGGRDEGGAGQPGNPSLSGPHRSIRGGANPMTPWPPPCLSPPGPSRIPAPGLPGDARNSGALRSPPSSP